MYDSNKAANYLHAYRMARQNRAALLSLVDTLREAVLEEAAVMHDDLEECLAPYLDKYHVRRIAARDSAKAIRALKSSPPVEGEGGPNVRT